MDICVIAHTFASIVRALFRRVDHSEGPGETGLIGPNRMFWNFL